MKKFWKVLGLGALVAGLTPYKVEKDEETGKTTYQALLWRGSTSEKDGEKHFGIDLAEGTLTQMLREKAAAKEEAHLFSDELTVDFHREEQEAAEASGVGEASVAASAAVPQEAAVPEAAGSQRVFRLSQLLGHCNNITPDNFVSIL